MKLVTFRGTGQLNGVRNINKTIELEDDVVQSLYGPNRYDVLKDIMRTQYPGVKVDTRQINYQVKRIPKSKNDKQSKNDKKPLTFWSIITWIIFFPFKLIWKILVAIWKEPHV